MRVLDNLENYDIPSEFHLTAEQEEQLAADLKEIVLALIPLRSSKLKTRQYFNSHLRYTSNVKYVQSRPDAPQDRYEFGDSYTPLPGEYTWDSDLLQPALLDILREDMYSFGFIVNYIDADLQSRGNDHRLRYSPITYGAIKFSLTFDIDEIRAKAKSIPDLTEHILFLNAKLTECKLYDGLDRDEEEWLGGPVFQALQSLIEEAEKEIKVKQTSTKKNIHIEPPAKQPQRTAATQSSRSFLTEDVLYDFTLCNYPQFAVLRMEVHGGCLTDPAANEFAFTSTLGNLFSRCYDPENKLARNKVYFEEYPRFILGLLDSYATHMRQKYTVDRRFGLRMVCRWMAKTRDFIDNAYRAQPEIYLPSRGVPDLDSNPQGSWPLKRALLSPIYQSFRHYAAPFVSDLTDQMIKVIPFNMWDDQYESLREKYHGVLGLEFDQRAVVNVRENVKRFYDTMIEQCITFCNQMSEADDLLNTQEDIFKGCYKPMTSLLHKYFRDFVSRIQVLSKDAEEIDNAIFHWLFSLQSEVVDVYVKNRDIIKRKCGFNTRAELSMMRFFYDICEKNVFDMTMEYFLDTEEIPIVKEDAPKPTTMKENEQNPSPLQPTEASGKGEKEDNKIHDKDIDYEKLFNEWNGIAFPKVSLEEFTTAIDEADFTVLMEKAVNAGTREGYIVSVKFIIKRLGQHLGNNWYDIACSNIGQSMNSINKINDGTKRISKINTRILSDCIK